MADDPSFESLALEGRFEIDIGHNIVVESHSSVMAFDQGLDFNAAADDEALLAFVIRFLIIVFFSTERAGPGFGVLLKTLKARLVVDMGTGQNHL